MEPNVRKTGLMPSSAVCLLPYNSVMAGDLHAICSELIARKDRALPIGQDYGTNEYCNNTFLFSIVTE
jgi:hypothetical protein